MFRHAPLEFDLVRTDMTMPKMTGDKLTAEPLTVRPDTLAVLCTGYNKRMSEEKAREIGIKAFIHKPVSEADPLDTLRRVLDQDGQAAGKRPGDAAAEIEAGEISLPTACTLCV